MSRRTLATLTLALLVLGPPSAAVAKVPAPVLDAGAVAAPDSFGAQVAAEVLRAGGNAIDAAVATAFALAVTLPNAGNLGGGGFMTLWFEGKPYFLDYRERAPAKSLAGMYLDGQGDVVAGSSLVGNLAVGTPGTVRGMAEAHRRFGRLRWKQVLAPAIALARDGFVVPVDLQKTRDQFVGNFAGKTNFEAAFAGLTAGSTFRQPELAATLERIATRGEKDFYQGRTAELLVAQMARGPVQGLVTRADLAAYKAIWRDPILSAWNGHVLVTAPPPSSGGIALIQLLTMKQHLAPAFEGVAHNSPQYIHLIAEIEKRVFADRAEYLGDPEFVKVPVARLIDPEYLARRAGEVKALTPSALPSVKPGLEKPQTTHFSVVDRWGNAVANTYTLNGSFGSGVVVEGAGFLLNNEMDDFSAKPGVPNLFGVVGGAANAIAPSKTPLSSMSPTIVLKDGKVSMVLGTPGGSRIFTWVFQVLVNAYEFKMPLERAVAAQRFHHQLYPENLILAEPFAPLSADLVATLKARGYRIDNQAWGGDVQAIQIVGQRPVAVSDPRERGVSLVIEP